MKHFLLSEEERRSLFEMGVGHHHPRVRRRAQALVRLAQAIPRGQVAHEFGVHLNSIRGWIERWQTRGLAGLYEEHYPGRPTKLSAKAAERLHQIAHAEGGTTSQIMRRMEEQHMALMVTPDTVARWLKAMGFSYKRYRTSLKKSVMQAKSNASDSSWKPCASRRRRVN